MGPCASDATTLTSPSSISPNAASLGVVAVLPGDRLRVDLRERARRQLASEPGRAIEHSVRAALWVGHEHAEAAVAKLVRRGVEAIVDAANGASTSSQRRGGGPLGHQLQLGL